MSFVWIIFGIPLAGYVIYMWIANIALTIKLSRRNRGVFLVRNTGAPRWPQTPPPTEYQCYTCGLRRKARWASCGRCNETNAFPV